MDRSDLQAAIFQQLSDAKTLRTRVREIDFSRDPVFKQVKVFAPADTRNQQMKIMDLFSIDAGQSPREEVSLLLVVSLNRHSIARTDESFESLNDRLRR
jgi:hypothetical protein